MFGRSVQFPCSRSSSLPHMTVSFLISSSFYVLGMHVLNSGSTQHQQWASWKKPLDHLGLRCVNSLKKHVVSLRPTNFQKRKPQEHGERPRQPRPRHTNPSHPQLKRVKQESRGGRVNPNGVAWKRFSTFSPTSFLHSGSIFGQFCFMERLMATPPRS